MNNIYKYNDPKMNNWAYVYIYIHITYRSYIYFGGIKPFKKQIKDRWDFQPIKKSSNRNPNALTMNMREVGFSFPSHY
jgi:hypothetical protein